MELFRCDGGPYFIKSFYCGISFSWLTRIRDEKTREVGLWLAGRLFARGDGGATVSAGVWLFVNCGVSRTEVRAYQFREEVLLLF